MQPWITLKNVEKTISQFHMGPLTVDFEPGTITALIGTNGAGKSTFCKMLMHLVKQDDGDIYVFDHNTRDSPDQWKHHIAYQPQNPVGYTVYTGQQLHTFISTWYPAWDEDLFERVVQLLHIPLKQKFEQMSEGSQQKLLFALTIARGADILLLDEPTAHMDIPSKKIVIDLLVEWMDEKERMIIISSHQIDDIRKLSDYLCVLHHGKIIGQFEKEALHESYKQYWFKEQLPHESLPGELLRQDNMVISEDAKQTEVYLAKEQLVWEKDTPIELEEIITLILTKQRG